MKVYTLLLIVVLSFLQSCQKIDVEKFEKGPSERMDERITHDLTVLKGAKNGWIMRYFPSKTQHYGGFNILLKFDDDDRVTASSERFKKPVSSSFQIIPESGPVLTFDDFNEVIHYYSNPKNPDGIGGKNTGMEGDYEFIIIEAKPEQVILKGKKTANKIVMTPVPEDKTWTELLDNTLKDLLVFNRYKKGKFIVDGKPIANVNKLSSRRIISFFFINDDNQSDDDKEDNPQIGFIKTENGFYLYEAFEPLDPLKKNRIEKLGALSFSLDPATSVFKCTNEGVDALFEMEKDFYELEDALGDWTISYTNLINEENPIPIIPTISTKPYNIYVGDESSMPRNEENVRIVSKAQEGEVNPSLAMQWLDRSLEDLPLRYNAKDGKMEILLSKLSENEESGDKLMLEIYGQGYLAPYFPNTSSIVGLFLSCRTLDPLTLGGSYNNVTFTPNRSKATGFAFVERDDTYNLKGVQLLISNITMVKK